MLSNVYLKTLRDMRRSLMWWSIGMFLFSLYFMTFYPTIEESGSEIQDYMESLPESMRAMFGGEAVDITTLEGFLSVELFSFMYPIMILVFAVSYGAGLVGNEEENGTLDVLLATPVPRWRILLSKYAALVTFTLLVLAVATAGLLVGGVVAGVDGMPSGRIVAAMFNIAPMGLFFAAVAYCMIGVRGSKGSALGITLAVAAVTYLIHTMAEIADIPGWLQKLSPWYYYNGPEVMREGLVAGHVALLLALTALLVAGGIVAFQRRDVGT